MISNWRSKESYNDFFQRKDALLDNKIRIPDKEINPSQYKSIEEAVNSLTEVIHQIDENNYNFLSIVFHDLRNPLTYVKMSIDVLITGSFGDIPPEQKELLDKSLAQIDRLNKMIDDVLLIAKLENNKLPMSFSSININNILEDTIKTNQDLLNDKNLDFDKKISAELPNSNMDYKYISMALNYLLRYCIKSTEKGGISLSCSHDEKAAVISIQLKDTSDCIGQENIPYIFDKFKCFGMMAKHKEERSGLELSICNEIIKKHNGNISFTTTETNGNHFQITLPI